MADNPLKYSDFIQPDASLSDLIKQLEGVQSAYGKMRDDVVGAAKELEAAIKKVNNTNAEGQETTKKGASEAEKLAKANEALAKSHQDTAKQIAELKRQQTEQNNINKLTAKLNAAAEGSFDKLSAQYALNRMALNKMSKEQREATDAGRALEEESAKIYAEMKRVQSATGQNQLNVGNYADANISLTSTLRANTQELIRMKLAGQEGTAAYQSLLKKTAELKDEIGDTKNEIKNMASDTSNLDAVLAGASAAGGGFAVFTGGMELFGTESKDVEKAQKTLQATIAITTGLQAIQNAVQKDGALMLGISRIQSYALSKAEVYRRLIQIQGTSATVGATIAQKAFNAVASVNPYVLLAMALVTVVGALALFSAGTESSAEKQTKANDAQKAYLDYLQIESDRLAQVSNERVKAVEKELVAAKARGAGSAEILAIEERMAAERKRGHKDQLDYYSKEIENLDTNRAKLAKYREELSKVQTQQAQGKSKVYVDLELNGNLSKAKTEEAITAIQGKIDTLGREIEIGTTLVDKSQELAAADADLRAKRIEQAKAFAKMEKDLMRKAEDEKVKLIENTYEQQRATISISYSRQISDLQYQLNNEKNLTYKGRLAILDTIKSLGKQQSQALTDLKNKELADTLTETRKAQDIEVSLMEDGFAKQKATTKNEYNRQLEDLQIRLNTERGLSIEQKKLILKEASDLQAAQAIALAKLDDEEAISKLNTQKEATELQLQSVEEGSQQQIDLRVKLLQQQRAIELKQNAMKTEDVRQSDKQINAKYDALVSQELDSSGQKIAMLEFDQQQALAASEFDLLRTTEAEKTRFKLEQEKARLKKILDLNLTAGTKLSDVEVQTIKNTIARIDKEIATSKTEERDFYSLAGIKLDDKEKEAIATSTSFAIEQVQSFLQSKVDAANASVEAANTEVEASKSRLDAEIEARNNGYASNVSMAQKELDLAKKNQDKALAEQEKARKAQAAIETLQQAGSLITATAGIWKSYTSMGPWGIAAAIAGTALMWGSFAAAKIKANQVSKQSYGEGGLEFLNGGSHASGNDIQIGTTADGKDRRAEGGEALAIIRKTQTRKYKRMLPGIIDSLNKGTFEKRYMRAYDTGGLGINVVNTGADLRALENDVKDIKKQGERRYFIDSKGRTIEVYKNLRRTYDAN